MRTASDRAGTWGLIAVLAESQVTAQGRPEPYL